MFKIKTFFYNLILVLFVSGCSSTKIETGKLLNKNINLEFDNCCLATKIKGSGTIKVYEKIVKIKIKNGSIKINPEYKNQTYTVGDIYMTLGKYIDKKKGIWNIFNKGPKQELDLKINSLNDSINLSGMRFEIPYSNKSDLEESWIIIVTTNKTRKGYIYSHSVNKKQKFEK